MAAGDTTVGSTPISMDMILRVTYRKSATSMSISCTTVKMNEAAADHLATIDWQRGAWSDKKGRYSRQHLWVLAGTELKASESGAVTPAAYRDNTPIDPHNMFVATIASGRGRDSSFGRAAPRTDPSGRSYRTGLLSQVLTSKRCSGQG